LDGGDGAVELAEAVVDACEDKKRFKFLYDDNISLNSKIELIAKEIYGANGVKYSDKAQAKLTQIQKHPEFKFYGSCMAKTHLSLSHDSSWKGRPEGWILPINDILIYGGAGIAVPVVGDVKLMPGTASDPAYRKIDIDVNTGKVKGLF
jgi:formate--tetrahydrofolate ligase